MEINRVGRNSPVKSEKRNVTTKKDFSQNFSFARQNRSQEQLKKMLDDIKKKGNRLVITKCYADVKAYKRQIKEYLETVLKHMYQVEKDVSFWQTQYYITIETVDGKLEELTQMFLGDEKINLDVAATIDEITGLVVDFYK